MSERMYDLDYILGCLDRCEHGRHTFDHCDYCPPGVRGNPRINDLIGYDVGGAGVYVHDLVRAAKVSRERGPGRR